ncbi:hypothetical protein V3565_05365 [Bartonella sp. B10]
MFASELHKKLSQHSSHKSNEKTRLHHKHTPPLHAIQSFWIKQAVSNDHSLRTSLHRDTKYTVSNYRAN